MRKEGFLRPLFRLFPSSRRKSFLFFFYGFPFPPAWRRFCFPGTKWFAPSERRTKNSAFKASAQSQKGAAEDDEENIEDFLLQPLFIKFFFAHAPLFLLYQSNRENGEETLTRGNREGDWADIRKTAWEVRGGKDRKTYKKSPISRAGISAGGAEEIWTLAGLATSASFRN